MKGKNEDRIRVKKTLKIQLQIEAIKIGKPVGKFIESIYKFWKSNNKQSHII